MKTTQKKTISIIIFSVLAISLLGLTPVTADSPTITISSLGETTGALPKEGDASVHIIMAWNDFSQNKTVDFRVYNTTGKLVASPETGYVIPVTTNTSGTPVVITNINDKGEEGDYETTFTISDLADRIGTYIYTMKVLDNTDNTTLATKDFTIYVAAEDIQLAVSIDDADGDDIVEESESVIFTYYVDWVSVEATETYQIYASFDEDGIMKNKGAVIISTGAGSDTGTFSKVWNTDGSHSVEVELRDPSGTVAASLVIPIKVGESLPQGTVTPASTTAATPVWSNPLVVIAGIGAAVAVVALLVKKK